MQCNVSIGNSVRSIDSKQKIHIEFCLAGFYVKYFSSRRCCCYCLFCWVLVFQLLSHFKSNPTHEIGKSAIEVHMNTYVHVLVCASFRMFAKICILYLCFSFTLDCTQIHFTGTKCLSICLSLEMCLYLHQELHEL